MPLNGELYPHTDTQPPGLLEKFNWDGATGGTTLYPVMSPLLQHWLVNAHLMRAQKAPVLNQFPSQPMEQHR